MIATHLGSFRSGDRVCRENPCQHGTCTCINMSGTCICLFVLQSLRLWTLVQILGVVQIWTIASFRTSIVCKIHTWFLGTIGLVICLGTLGRPRSLPLRTLTFTFCGSGSCGGIDFWIFLFGLVLLVFVLVLHSRFFLFLFVWLFRFLLFGFVRFVSLFWFRWICCYLCELRQRLLQV